MTPDELLEVFHRRIRLPDADTIPGWKTEHDGLVHRPYDDDAVRVHPVTSEELWPITLTSSDVTDRPDVRNDSVRLYVAESWH